MTGEAITIDGVAHAYVRPGTQQTHVSLQDVDLGIQHGEFFCLLGPSGCGKSTLLNVLAGFEPVATGRVLAAGEPITEPSASRGVVFQSDVALFPWLTVFENVAYGLKVRGVGRAEREQRVQDALELVHLWEHHAKFPRELSGGMRQRCQIARVIASDPAIVLMDEPFGALDAQTRRRLQKEFVDIWTQTRKTVVFVTHDVVEAVLLGDRVGVMTPGPAARMKCVVPVDLPRPRQPADPEFAAAVEALTGQLDGTHVESAARSGS